MITPAQPTNSQSLRLNAHTGLFWREWALLTAAGTLSALALLPATWALVQRTAQQWSISLPAFVAIQILASAVQVSILVALGLFFARRTGLGAPILESWLTGHGESRPLRPVLAPAISLGAAAAILVIALDRLVFAQLLPGLSYRDHANRRLAGSPGGV